MSKHPEHVQKALEVTGKLGGWLGPAPDTSWHNGVVLALDAAGLLLTPEDTECVEACVGHEKAFPNSHSSTDGPCTRVSAAGAAILAKRKKPERWTVEWCNPRVALCDNHRHATFESISAASAFIDMMNAKDREQEAK